MADFEKTHHLPAYGSFVTEQLVLPAERLEMDDTLRLQPQPGTTVNVTDGDGHAIVKVNALRSESSHGYVTPNKVVELRVEGYRPIAVRLGEIAYFENLSDGAITAVQQPGYVTEVKYIPYKER